MPRTAKKARPVGSSRTVSRAAAGDGTGNRLARGIHDDGGTRRRSEASARPPKEPSATEGGKQVAIRTPNVPGYSNKVDAAKYGAMKDILLEVLPRRAPGMTQGEMFEAVREKSSRRTFPGSTERWWAKTVQLDLEAKGVLRRTAGSPLRWHRP